jgi:hypothetical protein
MQLNKNSELRAILRSQLKYVNGQVNNFRKKLRHDARGQNQGKMIAQISS